MKAELYYFDECPSYRQALGNLNLALRREHLPEHVDLILVADAADAQTKRFIGSPTIRLDGVDVEGLQAEAQGYGFGCRVYARNGTMTGWPSVEQIRRALRDGPPPRPLDSAMRTARRSPRRITSATSSGPRWP